MRLAVFRSWFLYWLKRLTRRRVPPKVQAEWEDPVGDVQRYIAVLTRQYDRWLK